MTVLLCQLCLKRSRTVPATHLVGIGKSSDTPVCAQHAKTWSLVFLSQPRLIPNTPTHPTPTPTQEG